MIVPCSNLRNFHRPNFLPSTREKVWSVKVFLNAYEDGEVKIIICSKTERE
jgi:hypothetical protein